MIDTYMRQLSKELEADPPMEPIEGGVYEYLLEEDLAVRIKALQPQGFIFTATLGVVPKDREEDFLLTMLSGNLFGKDTFRAVLGLDASGKQIVLSRTITARIDYREFKEILEDFVQILTYWRQEAGITT